MGELRVGDQLYDDAGHTCRVTGVFDQPPGRPCFEVVFSDGSTIVADAEHRWLTHDFKTRQAARYRATTTKRPLDMLGGSSRFRGVTRHRDGRWMAQVQDERRRTITSESSSMRRPPRRLPMKAAGGC